MPSGSSISLDGTPTALTTVPEPGVYNVLLENTITSVIRALLSERTWPACRWKFAEKPFPHPNFLSFRGRLERL